MIALPRFGTVIALVVLLGGCASHPPTCKTEYPCDGPPTDTNVTAAQAPALAAAASPNATTPPAPVLPAPWHGVYKGTHVSVPGSAATPGESHWAAFEAPNASALANVTTIHIRVSWNATVPQPGVRWYFATRDRASVLAFGEGTQSPLLADVPASSATPGTGYDFGARSYPTGAFVQQDVAADVWYS